MAQLPWQGYSPLVVSSEITSKPKINQCCRFTMKIKAPISPVTTMGIAKAKYLLQPTSSDPSPQSSWPSQKASTGAQ